MATIASDSGHHGWAQMQQPLQHVGVGHCCLLMALGWPLHHLPEGLQDC